MAFLFALWLPILLAAVFVFIASSIIHMVLPYHKSSYRKLADEDKVRAAIRASNPSPGLYNFPFCTQKDLNSPETKAKFTEGPVGHMIILPNGPVFLPKFLILWFVFCLIVGTVVAYLAAHTMTRGATYRHVFGVVGWRVVHVSVASDWSGLPRGCWVWFFAGPGSHTPGPRERCIREAGGQPPTAPGGGSFNPIPPFSPVKPRPKPAVNFQKRT